MMIYELAEQKNEKSESRKAAVNGKLIADILELEPVATERIHCLGKTAPEKIRPVIFKLLDFRNKAEIVKTRDILKHAGVSICEDFLRKIRHVRNELCESVKPNQFITR